MSDTSPQQAILAALHRAILSVGKVKKDGRNPMFDSKYATLEQVLDIINPVVHEQGIAISQTPGYDAPSNAVTMGLSFIDPNGNILNYCTSQLPLGKIYKKDGSVQECNAQNGVAAQTYLARTQLGHVFRLVFTDDDGQEAVGYDSRDRVVDTPKPVVLKRVVTPPADAPDASWDKPVNGSYVFKGREWFMTTMSVRQLGAPAFASAGYPEEFKKMAHKELLKRVASGDNEAIDLVNSNATP